MEFKEGVSEQLKDLIRKCLMLKPEDRITVEQIVEHEFFKPSTEGMPEEKNEQLKPNQE